MIHSIEYFTNNWLSVGQVKKVKSLTKLTSFQIIDGQILCVHGGLSPDIRTLDQVVKCLKFLCMIMFSTCNMKFKLTLSQIKDFRAQKFPRTDFF